MRLVREHWDSLDYIKDLLCAAESPLRQDEAVTSEVLLLNAKEAWDELGDDVMKTLWLAPSKGGVFTTKERDQLREAANITERRRIAARGAE